jgi:hypothetical protein
VPGLSADHTPGCTSRAAIWIALGDNVATLNDGPLAWPLTARSKQYAGNVNATVGGITLNINRDVVGARWSTYPRCSSGAHAGP